MNDSNNFISEFYGNDLQRTAQILQEKNGYVVMMRENDVLKEGRLIEGHTLQYAEDCAENWVMGIIK